MNKDDIIVWTEAVKLFNGNRLEESMSAFMRIQDYSKASFNIAVMCQQLGDNVQALEFMDAAIERDAYLAVAYLQRAYSLFLDELYEDAFEDYSVVLELLLDNDYIDYSQLGMQYKLYKSEVLFNRAMCWNQLGDDVGAIKDIQNAQKCAITDDQKVLINEAARMGLFELTLFSLPADSLFGINDCKTKNLSTKKYLKEAKVVAASNDSEVGYGGFSGATILNRNALLKSNTVTRPPVTSQPSTLKRRPTLDRVTTSSASSRYPLSPPISPGPVFGKLTGISRSKTESTQATSPTFKASPLERTNSTKIRVRQSSLLSMPERRSSNSSPLSPTLLSNSTVNSRDGQSGSSKQSTLNASKTIVSCSTSESGSSPVTKVKFKFNHKGEVHCCIFEGASLTVGRVYDKIENKLKIENRCQLKYKDEVGDLYVLNDDDDLEMARETGVLWIVEQKGDDLSDFY